LLPNFDEYGVGYRERALMFDATFEPRRANLLALNNLIVENGKALGEWKRALKPNAATLTTKPFAAFSKKAAQSITAAARRYGEFLGLPVEQ
jgi:hypothetical protein